MKTLPRILAALLLAPSLGQASDRLVIHEWGTLTTRVMVGRIELVTPQDREIMASLSRGIPHGDSIAALTARLGRFTDPMLLDEESRRPNANLEEFLRSHAIAYFQPSP